MANNMSDEELDRNWQPNGRRPQSTIARSFSAELMDIFRIENSVTDLDKEVNERKQVVTKTADELASLEARLKEMEARLQQTKKAHSRMSLSQAPGSFALADKAQQQQEDGPPAKVDEEGDADVSKARSRPGTARATQQAPSSGNMPPTPGASEDGDRE